MSKKKLSDLDKLNAIRRKLGMKSYATAHPVQMKKMKLKNGTGIEAKKFEKGETVFILDADDKKVEALPVGEFDLSNGDILVINEQEQISEIRKGKKRKKNLTTQKRVFNRLFGNN